MKNVKTFSALMLMVMFTLAISITSCKKDDDGPSPDPIPPTGSTVRINVIGKITDTDGDMLSGVVVKLAGRTTLSDHRGIYLFRNIDVPKDRLVIKAALNGYFDCIRGRKTQAGDVIYADLMMQELPAAANINAASGGTVNIPGGARIVFQANSFVDQNGNPYTGIVKVYARHFNPASTGVAAVLPGGDLLGKNNLGENVSLYPIGMVEALLKDQSGVNEIKLASGSTAQLRMPIDPSQNSMVQNTVPLWHLNETTAIWKEEGEAVKNGNFFEGNVSHFSVWNCDYQGLRTDIIGKVIDCVGQPVANVVVRINNFMTLITNNLGVYETWVPAGYTITAQVLSSDNPTVITNSAPQSVIAVGGQVNNIPDITINCQTRISGNIKSCGTNLPAAAFIYFTWNGGYSYSYTTDGSYSVIVPHSTAINIFANGTSHQASKQVTSGGPQTNLAVGDLHLCDLPVTGINGFRLTGNGSSTYYSFEAQQTYTDIVDTNGDGKYDNFEIQVSGITQPDNLPVTFIMDLSQGNFLNGFTYDIKGSGNFTIILTLPNNTLMLHSGYGANITNTNTLWFTELGPPGGIISGAFEYDNIGGYVITEGVFSFNW